MAYIIQGKKKIRTWTCLNCYNKKNIVTKDACLICKVLRPSERLFISYDGCDFLCKVYSSLSLPTVSALKVSPGEEFQVSIPLVLDSPNFKEAILDAFEKSDEIAEICSVAKAGGKLTIVTKKSLSFKGQTITPRIRPNSTPK